MARSGSITPLPVVPPPALPPTPIDAVALRDALAASVTGEVRFDRLSRALYSTDASVYQIVPLGVVLPKTEADVWPWYGPVPASACRSRPGAAAPPRPARPSARACRSISRNT